MHHSAGLAGWLGRAFSNSVVRRYQVPLPASAQQHTWPSGGAAQPQTAQAMLVGGGAGVLDFAMPVPRAGQVLPSAVAATSATCASFDRGGRQRGGEKGALQSQHCPIKQVNNLKRV